MLLSYLELPLSTSSPGDLPPAIPSGLRCEETSRVTKEENNSLLNQAFSLPPFWNGLIGRETVY